MLIRAEFLIRLWSQLSLTVQNSGRSLSSELWTSPQRLSIRKAELWLGPESKSKVWEHMASDSSYHNWSSLWPWTLQTITTRVLVNKVFRMETKQGSREMVVLGLWKNFQQLIVRQEVEASKAVPNKKNNLLALDPTEIARQGNLLTRVSEFLISCLF